MLVALAACAPVPVPTSDLTVTPAATPSATIAPTNAAPVASSIVAPSPSPTIVLPEGGTLTIGVVGTTNLEMNAMPGIVQDALFDSLLRVNPTNGALEPGLAESFQVSNDALTITFRLRAGVKWHDGTPLTADDVATTLKEFSASDFRGTAVTDFTNFVRATALDAQTVQLTFSDAYCPALASIGTTKILPRAVASNPNFPKLTPAQMIGTGAFKFGSSNGDQFVLQRNADYFRGAPHIDQLIVRGFANATAMRTAFANQQIDLMSGEAGDYAALKKLTDANIVATNANEFIALLFNADTPVLGDARVRQALTYALDRNALLGDIGGQGMLIDASLLPGYWALPQNLPRYSFDPAKAKQLLADAGWRDTGDGIVRKNGKALQIDLWTEADDPILEPLAFHIRAMLANIGVPASLNLDDYNGWVTRAFTHRFDTLLLSRKIPLDVDQRWYWQSNQNEKGSGFNLGSYTNRNVDALFQAGSRVAGCDAKQRATIYADVYRALVADAPVAFLFAPKKYLVARARVLGLAPSPFAGDFWNANEWRVKP